MRSRKAPKRRLETVRDVLRKRTVADLLWSLEVAEPDLQAKVCHELGRRAAVEAIEPLRKRLNSPDAKVREAAAESLGNIGDPHAGPALLKLFGDANQATEVRDTCAFALGRLAYQPAMTELIKALADPSPTVRICAVSALAAIGSPGIAEHVRVALPIEQDPRVKAAMKALLDSLPRPRPRAFKRSYDIGYGAAPSTRQGFLAGFVSAAPYIGVLPRGSSPRLPANVFGDRTVSIDFLPFVTQQTKSGPSQTWPVDDD